ncbi:MAG: hypothetical protein KDC69_03750, partial [Flavobacteriaceae bacterium]|nr:hypothetical protein [Flavobacteriaceae bacterium]
MKPIQRFPLFFIIAIFSLIACKNDMKNQHAQNIGHPLSEIADTTLVLPPAWAFGVLYGGYTNQDQTIETVKKIQEHA